MALIGQIRKNSWLLIVVIGLALAAFVMMDMFSQNTPGANDSTLATINGEKLDYREFQVTQQAIYSGASNANLYDQRDFMWNFFVEKYLLQDEFEALGLGVSMAEIMELEFGNNLSPIIRQQFGNPQTGQVDRNTLNQYRQALQSGDDTDPQIAQLKREWLYQRELVVKTRMQNKVNAMVAKAIYTPSWMSASGNQSNVTMSFDAVKVPFDVVSDAQIEVTDDALEDYIKAHAAKYEKEEETRSVDYVVFDVIPSSEDSAAILDKMNTIKEQFASAKNDTNFIRANRGTFGPEYVKEQFVNDKIVDTAFNASIGTVLGPYMDNGQYRIAKIVDRKMIPDSVQSRHILRQARTQQEAQEAFRLIDSIKTEIEAGNLAFEDAARRFGTDATAQKGGDLGFSFPGQMVKPFNDLIFYHAEPGELKTVATQFGLHLVEVTDRKYINEDMGVRMAYISENIIPSDATQQAEYDKVFEFVRANREYETFKSTVSGNPNLRMMSADGLAENDHTVGNLGSNDASRKIVQWMFSNGVKENEVSNEVYVFKHPTLFYNQKYVVAALTNISGGKLASLESVRDEVTTAVANEKKAAILKDRMEGKDLLQLSSEYGVDIVTVEDINFETSFISELGNEPRALGAAYNLEVNDLSEPIKGNGGMIVLKLTNKSEGVLPGGMTQMQNIAARNMVTQINLRLWDALKDKAKIEDNRSRYF